MSNKLLLGAIAQDLYRAANAYHRKSDTVSGRFLQEALITVNNVDTSTVADYIKRYLQNISALNKLRNDDEKADAALVYSAVIQNYCIKNC